MAVDIQELRDKLEALVENGCMVRYIDSGALPLHLFQAEFWKPKKIEDEELGEHIIVGLFYRLVGLEERQHFHWLIDPVIDDYAIKARLVIDEDETTDISIEPIYGEIFEGERDAFLAFLEDNPEYEPVPLEATKDQAYEVKFDLEAIFGA